MIPIPSGAKIATSALAGLNRTYEFANDAAELPGRALKVLGEVEHLVTRVGVLVGRIERIAGEASSICTDAAATIRRVDAVTERASASLDRVDALNADAAATVQGAGELVGQSRAVISRAAEVADGAERAVAEAQRTAGAADALLRRYEPMATKAAPLAEKFLDSLSEGEVDAAIGLIDELPRLTEHLRSDILPILTTLDRVGPDINELLKVTYDVRRAILGIPGFGFFKKRGEEILTETEQEESEQREEFAETHRRELDAPAQVPAGTHDKQGVAP